jgi:hypothetical protein
MTCTKEAPWYTTTPNYKLIAINKKPWNFALELRRTPISPHAMVLGLEIIIHHALPMQKHTMLNKTIVVGFIITNVKMVFH